jgi:hypothetical protein
MLVLPLAYPKYCFPLVWGAFIFLLEPLCVKWGGPSLLKEGKAGQWTSLVRLLMAGILCGGYWELCNFFALSRWVYTVPFFSEGKLFEMPYLGFFGFPPFCVECFVMTNAVYLLRGGRHWNPDARGKAPASGRHTRFFYILLMAFGLCASEWTFAQMKVHTIDSRAQPLGKILEDISPDAAARLRAGGWSYPREVLAEWHEAKKVIKEAQETRIRQRLELVTLVSMGSVNARLLERVGIHSREGLRTQDPAELFTRLVSENKRSNIRETPLVKRRVIAWIKAARRDSAFY